MEALPLPGWVGPVGEEDVLPAGTEAKEGSLHIADKGAPITSPCIQGSCYCHGPPASA